MMFKLSLVYILALATFSAAIAVPAEDSKQNLAKKAFAILKPTVPIPSVVLRRDEDQDLVKKAFAIEPVPTDPETLLSRRDGKQEERAFAIAPPTTPEREAIVVRRKVALEA